MPDATYNSTLPTARDRVRYLLGDTDVDPDENALRPDETYDAAITQFGETEATAFLAEGLATEYAQQPDSVGKDGKTVTWRDRVKTWWALAARLRGALSEEASTTSNTNYVVSTVRPGEEARGEYAREEWWGWQDR